MTLTELTVSNKEQMVALQGGYSALLRFDMIYKRWFFDLYYEGEILHAGLSLRPDTAPLLGITEVSPGMIDLSKDNEEYEPYSELGARLALVEIAK